MQLREIEEVSAQLHRQGVAVHAISAEKGGAETVRARLQERDTAVTYPVHSDPDHALLARTVGDSERSLFIKKEMKASRFGGSYEDYTMVQPAFVVVDRAGDVRQAWSWNTEELAAVEPKEELKSISAYGGAPLVSVRPETADIGPSIKEGRRVRISKVSWTPNA